MSCNHCFSNAQNILWILFIMKCWAPEENYTPTSNFLREINILFWTQNSISLMQNFLKNSKTRLYIMEIKSLIIPSHINFLIYSGSLNNMGLNYKGLVILGCFSLNMYYRPKNLWLVESIDGEPQIRRTDCKVTFEFPLRRGSAS